MIYSAFIIGFLGSFHCIGMCGPIALSLPLSPHSHVARWVGHFIYQSGKISAYVVLGMMIGAMGEGITLLGMQKSYNMLLGLFLFLLGVGSLSGKFNLLFYLEQKMGYLKNRMGNFIHRNTNTALFSIGFLNGLLPCGLVYIAILGASSFGNLVNSVLYMFFFGLGVMPALVFVSVFGHFAGITLRNRLKKIYPLTSLALGIFLIFRSVYVEKHLPFSPFALQNHEIPLCSGNAGLPGK